MVDEQYSICYMHVPMVYILLRHGSASILALCMHRIRMLILKPFAS